MMRHVQQLPSEFRISLPTDEKGMIGRECPKSDCLGYFKIELGTGLQGDNLPCHCPYCGHTDSSNEFYTPAQNKYIESIVISQITKALKKDIEAWDRDLRHQTRGGFLKLSVEYRGHSHPVHYYVEKDLETEVVCDKCTLHYAIYGVFGYCPDCRTHNTRQILEKNLELVEKQISLAAKADDPELTAYLIADALENVVSAFDGFGRELCRIQTPPESISFQNIVGARDRLLKAYGFDLSSSVSPDEWESVNRGFQKRHLFAHNMGVVDKAYLSKANDANAIEGRKVSLNIDEIRELMRNLRSMATYMTAQL